MFRTIRDIIVEDIIGSVKDEKLTFALWFVITILLIGVGVFATIQDDKNPMSSVILPIVIVSGLLMVITIIRLYRNRVKADKPKI